MKYAVEMGSGAMIYVPSLIKVFKIWWGRIHRNTSIKVTA
jgi:hypothetical protein